MLSTSQLREEVDAIVVLVAQGKTEDARQKLNHLAPDVSSEYGRGALLALNGILNVIESKSADKMADTQKILRAAERIPKTHTVDDMDKGYLQTITKWAKTRPAPKEASTVPQA
jgi:hypothetical protein